MDITDGHPARPRIAEVDGLRALAALAVIFVHFGPAPLVPSAHSFFAFLRALDVLSLANLAVTFFYTLSGFLLTYLGVREFNRSGSFDVKRFYLRRGFRIWPLYFAILAIDLVLGAPWGPVAPAHSLDASQWAWITGHVWMFVGFLSNWSLALNYVGAHVDRTPGTLAILWSIAVEEQFYLFFPLLLLVILRSRRGLWMVALALGSVGIFCRLAFVFLPVHTPSMGTSGGMYYSTLTYADVFLCGSLAGWLVARDRDRTGFWFRVLRRRGVGVALLLTVMLLGLVWHQQLWHPYRLYSTILYGATGGVFALMILWTVSNPGTLGCRFLRSAPMRALGALSYAIYLWHPISVYPLRYEISATVPTTQSDVDGIALASFLQYLTVTISGAALAHGLIERPFLALKERWLSDVTPARPSVRPGRSAAWMMVLGTGGLLAAVVLQVGVQAHFGAAVRTTLSSLLPVKMDQVPLERGNVAAFYVPPPDQSGLRSDVEAESNEKPPVTAGSFVLTGAGELLRLRGDGHWIRMVGVDGQRIRVVNVGVWESGQGGYRGLEAVHRGGRWVVDAGAMTATNRNSDVREGTEREPIPGFWISPGGGGYVVRRMADASGPFVRVEATRASAYLVLNGQGMLGMLEGVPVSIRGQIRAHGVGKATLTLYDVVAANGTAKTYTAQAPAGEEWTTLVVRAQLEAAHPDARDNFSLGLFGVARGDWFDIRELSLFVGTLP